MDTPKRRTWTKRTTKDAVHDGASSSKPPKPKLAVQHPNGTFQIVNLQTGAYAGLLNDDDRSDVVNLTMGLDGHESQCSNWLITHLRLDEYQIRNVDFESYASCDPSPEIGDRVLAKWKVAKEWRIRFVEWPNICIISPSENPDLLWKSADGLHGTPLELGHPYTAPQCRWRLEAVGSTAKLAAQAVQILSPAQIADNLKKLNAVSAALHDHDQRSRCTTGTRLELQQQIRNWIADPKSQPIFWLRGQAGAGKTTIALTVAEERVRDEQPGASFIFSRYEVNRSNPQLVFPTIADQLARLHKPYAALLAEALAKENGVAGLRPIDQLIRLIANPLIRCKDFPSPTVIVIDALDECNDNDPSQHISRILNAIHLHLPDMKQLKFFITSRPEHKIRDAFSHELRLDTTSIALHDIETLTVDNDIKCFVREFFNKHARSYPSLRGWPAEDLIDRLVKRSGQLFIYASTAMRVIFDPVIQNPRLQLTTLLASHITSGMKPLDQLYLDILQAAHPVLSQGKSDIRERLRRILGAILVLAEPLSPMGLEGLLGLKEGEVHEALSHLHSVLVVPDTEAEHIRIIHKSFSDFITSSAVSSGFRIDATTNHTQLAIQCFHLMDNRVSELAAFATRALIRIVAHELTDAVARELTHVVTRELLDRVARVLPGRAARQLPNGVARELPGLVKAELDRVVLALADRVAPLLPDRVVRGLADRVVRDLADIVVRDLADQVAPLLPGRISRDLADRVVRDLADIVARDLAERVARELAGRVLRHQIAWELIERFMREQPGLITLQLAQRVLRKLLRVVEWELPPVVVQELADQVAGLLADQVARDLADVVARQMPSFVMHLLAYQLDDLTYLSSYTRGPTTLTTQMELPVTPNLQYACCYWALHCCGSDRSDILLDCLRSFSTDHSRCWALALPFLEAEHGALSHWKRVQSFLKAQFVNDHSRILLRLCLMMRLPSKNIGTLRRLMDNEQFLLDRADTIGNQAYSEVREKLVENGIVRLPVKKNQ